MSRDAALSLLDVSKTFSAQRALDRVCLDLRSGEIHALAGQNGSGKSTLVKLLSGYHRADPGYTATARGVHFELGSKDAAEAAGIRFVHQDLGLVDSLSAADNIFLSARNRGLRRLRRDSEHRVAAEALAHLGYEIAPDRAVGTLRESERTAVAIARAMAARDIRVLVLDEATAAMPRPDTDRLFAALRQLASGGAAVLFVSHHLDEVMRTADRVTVLRDGRVVLTADVAQMSSGQLVEHMLGQRLLHAELDATHRREPPAAGSALVTRRLSGELVRDLDLDVRPGEVLGVAGLSGSGREELGGLIAGRIPRTGTVMVDGGAVAPGDSRAAIRAGVAYVPPSRMRQALLPGSSVRENLSLGSEDKFAVRGRIRRKREDKDAKEWIDQLSIRPPDPDMPVSRLSGGNQQKVVMARWLARRLPVLILDQPTVGVDVGAKADIHHLVDDAVANGAAVVVCSNDAEELVRLSSSVLVLRDGRRAAQLTGEDVSVARIELLQLATTGSYPS
jgi:ribose transport system ATP-binding protein